MSNEVKIKAIGENKKSKWYQKEDGTKVECNEDIMMELWHEWCANPTASKKETAEFTIFEVTEPLLILIINP